MNLDLTQKELDDLLVAGGALTIAGLTMIFAPHGGRLMASSFLIGVGYCGLYEEYLRQNRESKINEGKDE